MKIVHKTPVQKIVQVFKITTISILIFGPVEALARKPAVEPVQGISIDEYKEVSPAQEKGFNFSNEERAPANNQIENAPEQKAPESTPVSWWPLLALPVGLAFMMWNLLQKGTEKTQLPNNVVPLPKRKENNDDDHIKKAS
ncbi:MAG: hypothetical protein COW00_15710 [Bdellovibrio sp. CG12_big_fil_rev_8_21_14_0_65_39_13]|nr:MAG: hypothetical protein COW78_05575 [Bdellovibrio sp. CG22_combo_CG10-13_8_21_14_all_39_27]PIQ58446.1 MAG: hypothetical protein COW00_15710 [Bdellovibrio sp. CG12_big_fil_rev_8_21_14_0_65_39_13]PIR35399.1 MAG: hypothetical protein COV37_07925 [Bdellovibrio sp. CG11_big_fil_rev_8_21_14_0_20_39_38]PJB52211.1 MAG: hypothetical protein CO099_13865 [Bdellovibrio sp. CG_4_9_14_3_um_filter_39_7]